MALGKTVEQCMRDGLVRRTYMSEPFRAAGADEPSNDLPRGIRREEDGAQCREGGAAGRQDRVDAQLKSAAVAATGCEYAAVLVAATATRRLRSSGARAAYRPAAGISPRKDAIPCTARARTTKEAGIPVTGLTDRARWPVRGDDPGSTASRTDVLGLRPAPPANQLAAGQARAKALVVANRACRHVGRVPIAAHAHIGRITAATLRDQLDITADSADPAGLRMLSVTGRAYRPVMSHPLDAHAELPAVLADALAPGPAVVAERCAILQAGRRRLLASALAADLHDQRIEPIAAFADVAFRALRGDPSKLAATSTDPGFRTWPASLTNISAGRGKQRRWHRPATRARWQRHLYVPGLAQSMREAYQRLRRG